MRGSGTNDARLAAELCSSRYGLPLYLCRRQPIPLTSCSAVLKRFFSLFLLVSYLLASPGLVYSMHFCGATMTGVSVAHQAACCCPVPKKPTGCCHNQKLSSTLKDVKLTTAQLKLPILVAVPAPPALVLAYRLPAPTYPADAPATPLRATAAPPPVCPAYVLGHAFLI